MTPRRRRGHARTILGLSNISFGLKPYPRQILNSVYLAEAIKAGLDASLIDVQSHGESDPVVRTADNTYEPRNRRVEVAVR